MRARARFGACGASVAVALWWASASLPSAAATLERIAATGLAGPFGLPQSQVSSAAEGPAGEVAYLSGLRAVFAPTAPGVARVIGAGSAVPDGTVAGSGDAALDDAGCVVAPAALVGGGEALYRLCASGGTDRLVGTGDMTTGGQTIARLDFGAVFAVGPYVAFGARLSDGADAVVRFDGTATAEVARVGAPAPTGGTMTTVRPVGLQGDGTVGLRVLVAGGRDGLFAATPGAIVPVMVEGASTLVGLLDQIEQAAVSVSGVWAFLGRLADGRSGVFRVDATQPLPLVEAVLLAGESIPSRPGATVKGFASALVPSVNARGDVAARATIGGAGSGAGVFATREGGPAELLFSTQDETPFGPLGRLTDPQLADDGSILVAGTPLRGGTGVFVLRDGALAALAPYAAATDLGRPDLHFRFVGGRVRERAEAGVVFGEHDALVLRRPAGEVGTLVAFGSASPIGGEVAELGRPLIDSSGRVFVRAGIAGGSHGEAMLAITDRGIVDRVVAGKRIRGGIVRTFLGAASEAGGDLTGSERFVAFGALVGAGGATGGLYAIKGRRPRRLERTGRQRRGIGEILAFRGRPAFVGRRRYAFWAEARDGATRDAIVRRRGRRRAIVLREGDTQVPRLPGRIVDFTLPDASHSAIVFRATTDGGTSGVVIDDWTAPRVALATGDPAAPAGVVRSVGRPVLAGNVVGVTAIVDRDGVLAETLMRFPVPAATAPIPVATETLIRAGDPLPGGGVLHAILGLQGAPSGALLARCAARGGDARQVLLRVAPATNLDPPQASQ